MNQWSIPQKVHTGTKMASTKKMDVLIGLVLPISLAVLTIPVTLMLVLKLIGMLLQ